MRLDGVKVVFVVLLPVGENLTKSDEDDLRNTLLFYKMNHSSVYLHIAETAEIIQSLRNFLACGQLATEEALREAASLSKMSLEIHDEENCVEFLVDVDVPQLLTEVLRSLYQKFPVFSSEEQVG